MEHLIKSEAITNTQKQHFHVLAVDDSVIDRKLLERLLTTSSYTVTFVESGDKALKYLGLVDHELDHNHSSSATDSCLPSSSQLSQQEALKINLIMTDFCMPGMSGYDLLKRLKESSWKDVPVVVMSSENVPSRINMCLEEGAEEFLLKPLQLSDLKKLQPCLLKSQNHFSADHFDKELGNNITNNDYNNENNNTKNNKVNIVTKRKAMSPQSSERRPKMKEVAVV